MGRPRSKERLIRRDGYALVRVPGHPRAHSGYVLEHILVVERLLGRPVPGSVAIHHIGQKDENDRLVVLQSQAEHLALHRRLRVLRAGGNPWTDFLCSYCHQPKARVQFYELKDGGVTGHCRECRLARSRVAPENRKRSWTRRKAVA